MKQEEIQAKLEEISKGLKIFDLTVNIDYKTFEGKLNERQTKFVCDLLKFFRKLNWQIAFNNYKELKYKEGEIIRSQECGTPVKISPCAEEYKGKTYFGILLGDIARTISHSIEDGIVTAEYSHYNPGIFVPELNKIIYGYESWWCRIESEKDLNELITKETIDKVWYMQLLKGFTENNS